MELKLSKRSINKIKKREQIIDAAGKLFLEKGFENTSMDDVSKEAELTKRTLYQYFLSKEDLFFAVALKGSEIFISIREKAIEKGKNALDKIRLSNKAYYHFYMENPKMFRIMNYIPENRQNCELSPCYRQLGEFKDKMIKDYMDVVEEGKQDGSINPELDTKMAVYYGLFSSVGLLNMVSAINGSFFWDSEGINESEFLRFSMDLLADALK